MQQAQVNGSESIYRCTFRSYPTEGHSGLLTLGRRKGKSVVRLGRKAFGPRRCISRRGSRAVEQRGRVLQSSIDRRDFLKFGAALFLAPAALMSLPQRGAKAAPSYSHPAWSVSAPAYEMNPYFHAQSTRLVDLVPQLDAIADLGV